MANDLIKGFSVSQGWKSLVSSCISGTGIFIKSIFCLEAASERVCTKKRGVLPLLGFLFPIGFRRPVQNWKRQRARLYRRVLRAVSLCPKVSKFIGKETFKQRQYVIYLFVYAILLGLVCKSSIETYILVIGSLIPPNCLSQWLIVA